MLSYSIPFTFESSHQHYIEKMVTSVLWDGFKNSYKISLHPNGVNWTLLFYCFYYYIFFLLLWTFSPKRRNRNRLPQVIWRIIKTLQPLGERRRRGGGVKLEHLWNKKAQINFVGWQHTWVDKQNKQSLGWREGGEIKNTLIRKGKLIIIKNIVVLNIIIREKGGGGQKIIIIIIKYQN